MLKKFLIILLCTLFVFHCRGLILANENVEVEKEEDVIAVVNGEKILRKDLDIILNVLKNLNQDTSRSTQMQILDRLIKNRLLKSFIEGLDIEVSNKEIQNVVEKYRLNASNSGTTFEEILESQGSNIKGFEKEVKERLVLLKYLFKDIDEDVKKDFFEANKSFFNGEKVKVSLILVDTRKMETETELEKARQKIENIRKQIDKNADFAELAKKYSDHPSSEKGGDIGFLERRSPVVESFTKAAFSLKVGEVSEPLKTPFGYNIIKVIDRKEGKEISYDEVKEMVNILYSEIEISHLVKSLIKEAKIEVFL
ncbi:MAG: peptidylprolyl isomerase [Candidatus Scalinduaceae bacterium]